jgi:HAD superfamily hydrolase (TIGR01509 family)
MLKAVIFDVDGTLVDTVDSHALAWQEALAEFGHVISIHDLHEQIGKGGEELLKAILSKSDRASRGGQIQKRQSALYEEKYLGQIRPLPKVRDLIEQIQSSGLSVALGSSCKREELDVYKHLTKIDSLDIVDVTGDDVERCKPHPETFAVALARLGVKSAEALAVGDTPDDAVAANKIGLSAIGLMSGGFCKDCLRASGCIAVYRDPADMLHNYGEWLAICQSRRTSQVS